MVQPGNREWFNKIEAIQWPLLFWGLLNHYFQHTALCWTSRLYFQPAYCASQLKDLHAPLTHLSKTEFIACLQCALLRWHVRRMKCVLWIVLNWVNVFLKNMVTLFSFLSKSRKWEWLNIKHEINGFKPEGGRAVAKWTSGGYQRGWLSKARGNCTLAA